MLRVDGEPVGWAWLESPDVGGVVRRPGRTTGWPSRPWPGSSTRPAPRPSARRRSPPSRISSPPWRRPASSRSLTCGSASTPSTSPGSHPVPDVPGYTLRAVASGRARGARGLPPCVLVRDVQGVRPGLRAADGHAAVPRRPSTGSRSRPTARWWPPAACGSTQRPASPWWSRSAATRSTGAAVWRARSAWPRCTPPTPRAGPPAWCGPAATTTTPEPGRVYRGIGFVPGPRTHDWALTRS